MVRADRAQTFWKHNNDTSTINSTENRNRSLDHLGAVHAFAGVIVLNSDASGGFAAIADAVDPALLAGDYHPAAGGILNQHGWNLLWFGVATLIGGLMIWRGNMTAIWVTGMVAVWPTLAACSSLISLAT